MWSVANSVRGPFRYFRLFLENTKNTPLSCFLRSRRWHLDVRGCRCCCCACNHCCLFLRWLSIAGVRACYDEGKRVAETLFFDFHRQHKIEVRVARIFNTYGPGMHPYGEKEKRGKEASSFFWGGHPSIRVLFFLILFVCVGSPFRGVRV